MKKRDMENNGWIKLHRSIEANWMWFLEPFTKAQAWIDLLINANHKDSTICIRGAVIPIKRGQIGWSEITMAKRWQWSRNKVRGYLATLASKMVHQIEQQKNNYTSIITIINYDQYQQQTEHQEVHQKDTKRYTNNNDKNNKNIKEINKERILEIANKYRVSEKSVNETYEDLKLWCESKGKRYKNYDAALCNWLRRNIASGKTKTMPVDTSKPLEVITEAQKKINLARLEEIRLRYKDKLHL